MTLGRKMYLTLQFRISPEISKVGLYIFSLEIPLGVFVHLAFVFNFGETFGSGWAQELIRWFVTMLQIHKRNLSSDSPGSRKCR